MNYEVWKSKYIKDYTLEASYVFYNEKGHSGEKHYVSVSEGHGYGMRIALYNDDYDLFSKLFNFYKLNMNVNGLMKWRQRFDVYKRLLNEVEDSSSVTDGDLDISLALLEAGMTWDNEEYKQSAKESLDNIWRCCINKQLMVPLLGDWVKFESSFYYIVRPSDFMFFHFSKFAKFHKLEWDLVKESCKKIIINFSHKYKTGLVSDFIVYDKKYNVWKRPKKKVCESVFDKDYYYNSCRLPWRLSELYLERKEQWLIPILQKQKAFFKRSISVNGRINVGYTLEGKMLSDVYYDLAFVAPVYWMLYVLGSSDMINDIMITPSNYYGDVLYMLGRSMVRYYEDPKYNIISYVELNSYKSYYMLDTTKNVTKSWEHAQLPPCEGVLAKDIKMDIKMDGQCITFELVKPVIFMKTIGHIHYGIIEIECYNIECYLYSRGNFLPMHMEEFKEDTSYIITLDWHKTQLRYFLNKRLIQTIENRWYYDPMNLVVKSKSGKKGVVNYIRVYEYK